MKALWVPVAVVLATPVALAQTTIYKQVDASGRVTYANHPMPGAVVVDLQPLSVVPGLAPPAGAGGNSRAASAVVRPVTGAPPEALSTTLASIEPKGRKERDDARLKTLEDELARRELSLALARTALREERENPALVAAVRSAQQAADAAPASRAEARAQVDRAASRIRGLQATVAELEQNVEALKIEVAALKR